MTDPCATERRNRNRAAIALRRNRRLLEFAADAMRRARADAARATPPLPGACLAWLDRATSGLSTYELNLFPPPCAGHVHGPCGRAWKWASHHDRAMARRDALAGAVREAQAALDAALAAHDDAAPDTGLPHVAPVSSETEADAWMDDPTPDDDELDALPSAPGGGGADAGHGATDSARCGAPRTGHGHEGDPCQTLVGDDGWCQNHGAVA